MGNSKKCNQYNLTKNDITKLLAKHDPMDLICTGSQHDEHTLMGLECFGAPDDEYEPEAELVDNFCRQNPDKFTKNYLSVHIKYIFVHMFSESSTQEITDNDYLQIANDIIKINEIFP